LATKNVNYFTLERLMSTEPVAVERTWFAVAPDGTEHELVLRVYVPVVEADGVLRAHLSLGVLQERTHGIAGVDGWQAVTLAMKFAAFRLGHFIEDGWQFYWERGGEIASPSQLTDGL
jgi:hypothetical protein